MRFLGKGITILGSIREKRRRIKLILSLRFMKYSKIYSRCNWLGKKKKEKGRFIKFSINFQFTPCNINTDPYRKIVFSACYQAFIFIVARLISGTKVYCLKRD